MLRLEIVTMAAKKEAISKIMKADDVNLLIC